MYLNEGTLLNNLRRRYKKDRIYVSGSEHDDSRMQEYPVDLCGEYSTGDQSVQRADRILCAGNHEEIQRKIVGCDAAACLCYWYAIDKTPFPAISLIIFR